MLAAKSFIFISLRAFYVKICLHHQAQRSLIHKCIYDDNDYDDDDDYYYYYYY